MIVVKIGPDERRWDTPDDVEVSWVTHDLVQHRLTNSRICVVVRIETSSVNVELATSGCGPGAGGRPPHEDEQRIIDLWNERGMNDEDFAPGQLVAFLKRLDQLL